MYFNDIYKPIPPIYNLVMAMLWRHPENIDVDKVKVVHYCAAVCVKLILISILLNVQIYNQVFDACVFSNNLTVITEITYV